MKKTFSILASLLICATVHAQLAKNTIMLGGSLNAYSTKSDYVNSSYANGYRNSNIAFEPYAGYFITDKSIAGIRLGFGRATNTSEYTTYTYKTEQSAFSAGVFHRQYFSLMEKAAFFLNSTASFGTGKQNIFDESSGATGKSKYSTIYISTGPGLNYFINTKWGVEARFGSIYYSNGKSESEDPFSGDGTNSSVGLNVSLNNFFIGLQYFISR